MTLHNLEIPEQHGMNDEDGTEKLVNGYSKSKDSKVIGSHNQLLIVVCHNRHILAPHRRSFTHRHMLDSVRKTSKLTTPGRVSARKAGNSIMKTACHHSIWSDSFLQGLSLRHPCNFERPPCRSNPTLSRVLKQGFPSFVNAICSIFVRVVIEIPKCVSSNFGMFFLVFGSTKIMLAPVRG